MKKMVRLSCLIFAIIAFPALSFAVNVTADVSPGYGGLCKIGCWNPVTITLWDADKNIDGYAVVTTPRGSQTVKYKVPINLPQSSRKQFTIYVPFDTYSSQFKVEILNGKKSVKDLTCQYRDAYEEDYLLVTAGNQQSALNFLSGTQLGTTVSSKPQNLQPNQPGAAPTSAPKQVQVGHLAPSVMPDKPAGYDAVNTLVLTDFEASRINVPSLDALKMWIASGGSVVVCGGADYARLKSPFFQEILPVDVDSSVEVSELNELAAKYGYPLQPGKIFVCKSSPKSGTSVIAGQGDMPLMVQGKYGLGSVTFLAFDPFSFPLKGWDGQVGMWKEMLLSANTSPQISKQENTSQNQQVPARFRGSFQQSTLGALEQAALMMKSTEPPSLGLIASFLIAYLVALVPLNYFYVRRKGRFELAWISTPAIILFFTFGAYAFGYTIRGSQTIVNRISLIEAASDTNMAGLTGYFGIYAPGRSTYSARVNDSFALASEGGGENIDQYAPDPAEIIQGDPPSLENIDMRQWSGRTFRVRSGVKLKGRLESDLVFDGNQLKGTITNRTGFDLTHCNICFGDIQQSLFDLNDGQSIEVKLAVAPSGQSGANPIPVPAKDGITSEVSQQVAYAVSGKIFSCGEPIFTGWIEGHNLPVRLNVRAQGEDASLAIFHLRYKYGSTVMVPKGLVRGVISEQDQNVQVSSDPSGRSTGIFVPSGLSFVEDFKLQAFAGSASIPTKLTLWATYTNSAYLFCYNWKTSQWVQLAGAGNIPIPDPAVHIRTTDGLVRIKFKALSNVQDVNLQIEAEGRRE